jgi:hypothetical protein
MCPPIETFYQKYWSFCQDICECHINFDDDLYFKDNRIHIENKYSSPSSTFDFQGASRSSITWGNFLAGNNPRIRYVRFSRHLAVNSRRIGHAGWKFRPSTVTLTLTRLRSDSLVTGTEVFCE